MADERLREVTSHVRSRQLPARRSKDRNWDNASSGAVPKADARNSGGGSIGGGAAPWANWANGQEATDALDPDATSLIK